MINPKIHKYINIVLNEYIKAGITLEDLTNFLNTDEANYKLIYNKIYQKLTLNNIQFESSELSHALKENIIDKINIINDLKDA
jgi:hypothetical protein